MAQTVKSKDGARPLRLAVFYPAASGEQARLAARALADGLTAMLGEPVAAEAADGLAQRHLRLGWETRRGAFPGPAAAPAPGSDGFALWREAVAPSPLAAATPPRPLVLAAGTERALLHAVYALMERLGARFPIGNAPAFPRGDRTLLDDVEERTVAPAFGRRAFASDIMTWHYETPERLAAHLEYDRAFIPWMAARGLNAFSYIRNTVDSRLKIDELVPIFRERGIASEYGGHVLQLLMPRDRFDASPEYFPLGDDGKRDARGNLCVSNRAALEVVRAGAARYVRDNPECELLHIWGADVREGAWCRCGECAGLSPQLQYMGAVNAIAGALARDLSPGPPVAYLAYHDTLEPDSGLRPQPNVSFEWAPRERCYSHAIDDPACEVNPRYFESLKRYLELFDGRGHVFEYYADAILFGGLAIATPAIIARDLRAYRALGITSVSCLTFGAHSVLAYPVNLEAFARGTRSPDFEPDYLLADTVAQLHPACGPEMAEAYRAIARASALVLNGGGDVMHPRIVPRPSQSRQDQLRAAYALIDRALAAADHLVGSAGNALSAGERAVWHYGREVVSGIAEYIAAGQGESAQRRRRGEPAIERIGHAIDHLRESAPAAGNTWACWDLEWIREVWLAALRRRLDQAPGTEEER